MPDDMFTIAARIETLDAESDAINADKASVWKDAKRIKGLDVAALRVAVAERRRRDKNPAAYEALKGTAAEYLDALDNGVVVEHARAPARARAKITETDRAATSSVPEGPADLGKPPRPDPIPQSPAGGPSPNCPTVRDQVAASPSSDAVPAGEPPTRANLAQVAGDSALDELVAMGQAMGGYDPPGYVPPPDIAAERNSVLTRHVSTATPDLARMSESELVERALSHKPKHMGGAV